MAKPGKPSSIQQAEALHTSIVYFHGMGRPKRYEELSRLLDGLDRFVAGELEAKGGLLRDQKVRVEPSRVDEPDPTAFVAFRLYVPHREGRTLPRGRFRLYESYWSPAAAGPAAAAGVLFWLIGRMLHPITVLARPWRAHQRLKRTYLYRMFYDRDRMPAVRYRELAASYREFEGMEARRSHSRGTFGAFQDYVAERYQADQRARADLLALARHWRRTFVRSQLAVLGIALTAIAGFIGLVAGIVYLAAFTLALVGIEHPVVQSLVDRAGIIPAWLSMLSVIALLVVAGATIGFLRLYLSDVVFWTTTLEKDVRFRKRREILKAASDTIQHVLADPGCNRIVIVGHSLGTAIAYETLLALGRRLRADREAGVAGSPYEALNKISHFITLGSPIDRINYFFHLTYSRYHRFNRIADELMGRSCDLPFRDGSKVNVHWVNVRDRADPISSRLFSLRGLPPNRDEIHEVEASSGHFPWPATAHTGYFESRLALKILFDACILGRTSLQLQSGRPRWSSWLAGAMRPAVVALVGILTWSVAFGGYGYIVGEPGLMRGAQIVGLVAIAAIVALRVLGGLMDTAHRLRLES